LKDLVSKADIISIHIASIENAPLPEPIDWAPINEMVSRVTGLRTLISGFDTQTELMKRLKLDIGALSEEADTLHKQHHDLLVEAGVCPVCGQSTEALDGELSGSPA
jgi:hypothetical protein